MMVLLHLLLSLTAQAAPCVFPENATILAAELVGPNKIAVTEENTRCLYLVAPENKNGPQVIWAMPLVEFPSDLKFHKQSNRLFLFHPNAYELRSLEISTLVEKVDAKLEAREQCQKEDHSSGVSVKNCQKIQNAPYKIFLGEKVILLSYRNSLLVAPIHDFNFRALSAFGWFFNDEISYHAETGRMLMLENQPAGESLVYWYYILPDRLKMVAPLPTAHLLSADIKHLYFLGGDDFFLTNGGLVYRTNDLSLMADIGQRFDEAHMIDDKFITVRETAEKPGIFKTTVYNSHLRPISFDYFFQRPLLITGAEKNNIYLYVMPSGKLSEIFHLLPLRKSS